jgi:hypothetical protein
MLNHCCLSPDLLDSLLTGLCISFYRRSLGGYFLVEHAAISEQKGSLRITPTTYGSRMQLTIGDGSETLELGLR